MIHLSIPSSQATVLILYHYGYYKHPLTYDCAKRNEGEILCSMPVDNSCLLFRDVAFCNYVHLGGAERQVLYNNEHLPVSVLHV